VQAPRRCSHPSAPALPSAPGWSAPIARPRKAHFRVVIVAIFTQIACHIFKREFFFSFQMVGKIFEARIGM